MHIKNLPKKDYKHVKSLLSSLKLLEIRTFLIDRNAYTTHNKSALLLHTLLMGDYETATFLVDDELSTTDYITIAKFGDNNIFDLVLYSLSDAERPKLALTLINNFDKTFDVFEKCESIIKLKAIDDSVLNGICIDGREEILKYFICYLNKHKAKENNSDFLEDLVKIIIHNDNIFHLKMLLRYVNLTNEDVLQLGQDQFAWYVCQKNVSNDLVAAIISQSLVFQFKLMLKVRRLNDYQIEKLFAPECFSLFCEYVAENSLPEKFEKILYGEGNAKYLSEYLKHHHIGIWKYIRYNLLSAILKRKKDNLR